MIRRRFAAVVAVAALTGGLGAAHVASAATAQAPTQPGVDLRSDDERYWACLAVDHVEVGTCIENPLPDLSGVPSVPEVVGGLVEDLPLQR